MAKATASGWSNEDKYVSRLNLRCEKHLKKQIDVLEKEKIMLAKSLDAEKRAFQDRSHRLNIKPENIEHLSEPKGTTVVEQNRELDRLFKSLVHRPYMTGSGYSYIEYLSRNMQPLVKRPLQWGINPPLPTAKSRSLPNIQGTDQETFFGRVNGHPANLNQRGDARRPVQREKPVILPPIATKTLPVQQRRPHKRKPVAKASSYVWKREAAPPQTSTEKEEPERHEEEGRKSPVSTPQKEKEVAEIPERDIVITVTDDEDTVEESSSTFVTDVRMPDNTRDDEEPEGGDSMESAVTETSVEKKANPDTAVMGPEQKPEEETKSAKARSAVLPKNLDSRRHSV
ncbi:uncharacterized protein LOC5514197 [Nematostella vectensis]|uniref:uncharacterized protein LOC5514197 n=1 Tax=Nematostella vectensis TaxID=45351 RepID=UPI0020775D48|nr:uncharacterized protein LOC5514197 [Nematostella vectensis]